MRTEAQINSILADAKLAYSYKVQVQGDFRQRGLSESIYLLKEGLNLINAFPAATDQEKNLFCDILIRKGFVLTTDQLMFSEEIYNEDFDIV